MKNKPEYVTDEVFVVVWAKVAAAGGDLDEVAAELGRRCLATGRPEMPRSEIAAKANALKAAGVRIPTLKVSRSVASATDRLNALIARVADGEEVAAVPDLPPVPPAAVPPTPDPVELAALVSAAAEGPPPKKKPKTAP